MAMAISGTYPASDVVPPGDRRIIFPRSPFTDINWMQLVANDTDVPAGSAPIGMFVAGGNAATRDAARQAAESFIDLPSRLVVMEYGGRVFGGLVEVSQYYPYAEGNGRVFGRSGGFVRPVSWWGFYQQTAAITAKAVLGGFGATIGTTEDVLGRQLGFLNTNPITGARGQGVTGAYVLTEPNRLDADGTRQYNLTDATLLARYFPERTATMGSFTLRRRDVEGSIQPETILLSTSGATGVRTVAQPAQMLIEGRLRNMNIATLAERGLVFIDGFAWTIDSLTEDENNAADIIAHRFL